MGFVYVLVIVAAAKEIKAGRIVGPVTCVYRGIRRGKKKRKKKKRQGKESKKIELNKQYTPRVSLQGNGTGLTGQKKVWLKITTVD